MSEQHNDSLETSLTKARGITAMDLLNTFASAPPTGHINDWPQLQTTIRWAVARIANLKSRLEAMRVSAERGIDRQLAAEQRAEVAESVSEERLQCIEQMFETAKRDREQADAYKRADDALRLLDALLTPGVRLNIQHDCSGYWLDGGCTPTLVNSIDAAASARGIALSTTVRAEPTLEIGSVVHSTDQQSPSELCKHPYHCHYHPDTERCPLCGTARFALGPDDMERDG